MVVVLSGMGQEVRVFMSGQSRPWLVAEEAGEDDGWMDGISKQQ